MRFSYRSGTRQGWNRTWWQPCDGIAGNVSHGFEQTVAGLRN